MFVYLFLLIFALTATFQLTDAASVEDMSTDMLKQEIQKGLEEIAKREEVFVIIIDAINQVIKLHVNFLAELLCNKKVRDWKRRNLNHLRTKYINCGMLHVKSFPRQFKVILSISAAIPVSAPIASVVPFPLRQQLHFAFPLQFLVLDPFS